MDNTGAKHPAENPVESLEDGQWLVINDRVQVPKSELSYRFSRSGGPGGQNVNKVETSVELLFDLAHTPSLSEPDRGLAMQRLRTYLDSEGMLRLVARSSRSQLANRVEVTKRFVDLLAHALIAPKKRRPTRPSRGAKARRVAAKRREGQAKRQRTFVYEDE